MFKKFLIVAFLIASAPTPAQAGFLEKTELVLKIAVAALTVCILWQQVKRGGAHKIDVKYDFGEGKAWEEENRPQKKGWNSKSWRGNMLRAPIEDLNWPARILMVGSILPAFASIYFSRKKNIPKACWSLAAAYGLFGTAALVQESGIFASSLATMLTDIYAKKEKPDTHKINRMIHYKQVNINSTNKDGKTALELADENGDSAMILWLFRYGVYVKPAYDENIPEDLKTNNGLKHIHTGLKDMVLKYGPSFLLKALRAANKQSTLYADLFDLFVYFAKTSLEKTTTDEKLSKMTLPKMSNVFGIDLKLYLDWRKEHRKGEEKKLKLSKEHEEMVKEVQDIKDLNTLGMEITALIDNTEEILEKKSDDSKLLKTLKENGILLLSNVKKAQKDNNVENFKKTFIELHECFLKSTEIIQNSKDETKLKNLSDGDKIKLFRCAAVLPNVPQVLQEFFMKNLDKLGNKNVITDKIKNSMRAFNNHEKIIELGKVLHWNIKEEKDWFGKTKSYSVE